MTSVWEHTPGTWEYHRPTMAQEGAWIYAQDERPICELNDNRNEYEANARLIAAAPTMAETLLWIRENLHPKTLGRAATDAELLAITYATKVLREAGVIPTPVLEPAPEPTMPQRGRPRTKASKTYMKLDGETVVIPDLRRPAALKKGRTMNHAD